MARIQQIDQVYVDVRQPASVLDTLRQQAGSTAPELTVDILGSDGKPLGMQGHILFSGIEVDAGTGDVLLRVLVDNPERRLLPGLYVQARIPRARYANALSVPQQAVVRTSGQTSVGGGWPGQAQLVPVNTAELVNSQYRIASGLNAGQRVVIEGIDRLTPGTQVIAHPWQSPPSASRLTPVTVESETFHAAVFHSSPGVCLGDRPLHRAGGVIAIPKLPISRYPSVAPVSVTLYATYPGATPQTLNDAVVSLIERELSGVKNLLYFESSVDASGSAQITATFKPGTDPELAQMDVQNRIKAVEPRLPQAVRQTGLQVESASSGFLMMVGMTSPDGRFDEVALNDYMARNIVQELRRIDGVGECSCSAPSRPCASGWIRASSPPTG